MFTRGGATYLGNLEDVTPSPVAGVSPVADLDDAVPPARLPSSQFGLAHQVWSSFEGNVLYMGATTKISEIVTVLDIADWDS